MHIGYQYITYLANEDSSFLYLYSTVFHPFQFPWFMAERKIVFLIE